MLACYDGTNWNVVQTGTVASGGVAYTKVSQTGLTANVSSTTIATPGSNGVYRASCYTVVTTAASTTSTLPYCQLLYTDPGSNVAETIDLTNASAGSPTPNGTVGGILGNSEPAPVFYFDAKGGVAIQYATTGYASTGGTSMVYSIFMLLEGPF
jgi:hypothetical protein